jgi:hypothetical protein
MNGGPDLYSASVPVLRHYLGRVPHILAQAEDTHLSLRLAEGMFSVAENIDCAVGFALRAVLPPTGHAVPDLPPAQTVGTLIAKAQAVADQLATIDPEALNRVAHRSVSHIAGEAHLDQPAFDYVTLFAMPNFFFHLCMAYAGLRAQGVPMGKADFDGLHAYSPGSRVN